METNIQAGYSDAGAGYRPPDAVKSHQVKTVSNVDAFNLFDLSSFNQDTMYPRPAFIFPVLGNLPLVGNMFRFGRGAGHSYFQSVVLVNATIVPRSLNLFGFYGANFAARRPQHTSDLSKTLEKFPD